MNLPTLKTHVLEHGLPITTKQDRLLAKTALETLLNAEIKGQVHMTRKEVERVVNMYNLIKNNL
jgi:hypothetical protein